MLRFLMGFSVAAAAVMAGFSIESHAADFERDIIGTDAGDLAITFIGHATLMFEFNGMVVQVDPQSRYADYAQLPKADIVLITHEHGDHLDRGAIDATLKDGTSIIMTEAANTQAGDGLDVMEMHNGDTLTVKGLTIDAVPAYNIVNMRGPDQPYHPKGVGNGYIIDFGGTRVYVAGDTENIPEMKALTDIDVAFLPMNLPYTMTPAMAADAAKAFKPAILYPYHFGDTDTGELVRLLADTPGIEVRIRAMQ